MSITRIREAKRAALTTLLAVQVVVMLLLVGTLGVHAGSMPSASPAIATQWASPPASVVDATPVLAYYYIWFNQDSWDRAKIDFPSLGRYSSDDAQVMRQHIQWAKAVGIDGFIVSWKNTEVLTTRLTTLVEISNEEHFKLAVIYQGLDVNRKPLPAPRIASDLDFFAEKFGGNAAFDLFDKPVVVWSGTWEFSRDEIASVTEGRRDRLLILASDRNPDDYRNHADLFDGNAYYWSSVDPTTYGGYEAKLTSMGNAVHETDGLWIAPAAPGFDARLLGGQRAVSREGGNMLRTQLSAAYQSAPDAIGIISWNEFSENSQVEPSCLYGTQSLGVLADFLGGKVPAPIACGAGGGVPRVATPAPSATTGGNTTFSVEQAESTIAIASDPKLIPWASQFNVDSSDAASSVGSPRLRLPTLVLLVVLGGFVGGCLMIIMYRAWAVRISQE